MAQFEEQYKRLGIAVPNTTDPVEKAQIIYVASCIKLGLDPNNLPDVSKVREKHQAKLIADAKLMVIRDAIVDDREADWNDEDEYKYGPWFWMDSPGFRLNDVVFGIAGTCTPGGSRLCTFNRPDGNFFVTECIALWADSFGGKLPA